MSHGHRSIRRSEIPDIDYVLNDANSSYFAIKRDDEAGALRLIREPVVDPILG